MVSGKTDENLNSGEDGAKTYTVLHSMTRVLKRLCDVFPLNALAGRQVRNCSRDLQDPVVAARAEPQLLGGREQQRATSCVGRATSAHRCTTQVRIHPRSLGAITFPLNRTCRDDARPHSARRLTWRSIGNRCNRNGGYFHDQINAVAKRTRHAAVVPCDVCGGASADAVVVTSKATRAWVHCGNQHETGGKGRGACGARNRHATLFERLSHHFKDAPIELRHLIEEEDAVVRQ